MLLHGQQGLTSSYVLAIEPGRATRPERHIYDEYLVVLEGEGETRVWRDGDPPRTIRWRPGSLFSPPLNALHEHHNTGAARALLLGVTNAPPVLDFYRSHAFVFENDFSFEDRFAAAADAFPPETGRPAQRGNGADPYTPGSVPDVLEIDRFLWRWPDKDGRFATFRMGGNTLMAHVSRTEPESYQAPHRHAGGATLVTLTGSGYWLLWPREAGASPFADGTDESVLRLPTGRFSLNSPPAGWYHTHFNTSDEPEYRIGITPYGGPQRVQAIGLRGHFPELDAIEGPLQEDIPRLIEKEELDPGIVRDFEAALEARAD